MTDTRNLLEEESQATLQEDQIIQLLKELKLDGSNCPPLKKLVPMAAKKNQFDLVFKLIDSYKCDANEIDNAGCTALSYAFEHGNSTALKNLRERGAKIISLNIKDNASVNCVGLRARRSTFPLFLTKKEWLNRIKPSGELKSPSMLSKTRSQ